MKNLENTTILPKLLSEEIVGNCDICKDPTAKKYEFYGKIGKLCDNPKCQEEAERKILNKISAVLLEQSDIPLKYRQIKTDKDVSGLINKKGVFICGSSGTGKTVMACSIALEHIKQGKITIFKSIPKFIMELQDSYKSDRSDGEESAYEKLKKLSEMDVIVLDDLGAEKMTDFVRQALYFIINEREQWDRTTIITSNYELGIIGKNTDSRISSRIAGMCEIIHLKGKDRRIS